ncbi:uncharacterized protein [Leptinotarsa decemlineata]|uniref:uncharacterized protein n=1 Tax=Leptinotarsa decemlineata TaxID=7539 RepID=UPI003D309CD4
MHAPTSFPPLPMMLIPRGACSSTFSTTTPVIQSSPAILNQKQCTIRRGAKFEMASNTQELNNAVASIMPMTEQEKASTSRVRCRSTSPDLFEEEEEVRPVKKVCQRPAAKVGPISKYRATCNRTNPYAGSWSTAPNSLRPSTPPAAVVEQPRAPSPEEPPVVLSPSEEAPIVFTPSVVPLSPMLATPVTNPEVLVPQVRQPIGEVSEMLDSFLQRCKEAEHASRASEAALVKRKREMAEIVNRRREAEKVIAELDRKYASLEKKCEADTSSIETYKKLVTFIKTFP